MKENRAAESKVSVHTGTEAAVLDKVAVPGAQSAKCDLCQCTALRRYPTGTVVSGTRGHGPEWLAQTRRGTLAGSPGERLASNTHGRSLFIMVKLLKI